MFLSWLRGKQGLMSSGFGDVEADEGPLNPNYDPDLYTDYSLVSHAPRLQPGESCTQATAW